MAAKSITSSAANINRPASTPAPAFDVQVDLRVCYPCDADSWENDNPDHSQPGFIWRPGTEEDCIQVKTALLNLSSFSDRSNPISVRRCISNIIPNPFKARVILLGAGFRISIELY